MRQISRKKEAELRAANNGALPRTTFKPNPDAKRLNRTTQLNASRAYASTQEEHEEPQSHPLRTSSLRSGDKPLKRDKPINPVSKQQRKRLAKDAEWHDRQRAFWGGCVLCGAQHDPENGVETYGHHAYSKGANPGEDVRNADWNGIELCNHCHTGRTHSSPELLAAFRRIADERKAAEDRKRPEFLPSEAIPFINDGLRAEAERKERARKHRRETRPRPSRTTEGGGNT